MPYLQAISGPLEGQLLELAEQEMIIGRHPACQVVLDGPAVSRYHARISWEEQRWHLSDLGSRNGTFLNGEVISDRQRLGLGDRVRICRSTFVYLLTRPRSGSDDATDLQIEQGRAGNGLQTLEEIPSAINRETIGRQQRAATSEIVATREVDGDSDHRHDVDSEKKLTAIMQVGRSIGRHLDLDDALNEVLEEIFPIFPAAERACVLLCSPETDELVLHAGMERDGTEITAPPGQTIAQQAIRTRKAILSGDVPGDPRWTTSESVHASGVRSTICVPLFDREDDSPLGVVQMTSHGDGRVLRKDDLELLIPVSQQIQVAIEYSILHHEVTRQRDIGRDLELAKQVQRSFLPNSRPEISGYTFADHYAPAQDVGGDYFDYIALPDNRIAFAIADVSGKGISAALMMARLYSMVRSHLLATESVSEAMTAINTEICTSVLGHRFVTCCIGMLDCQNNLVKFANAGHLPPLIRRSSADESGQQIDWAPREQSGLPLGILSGTVYREAEISLQPGEQVVMYTDGITEAISQGGDLFGLNRLADCFCDDYMDAANAMEHMLESVDQHTKGSAHERDDVCALILERTPLVTD